MCVCVCMCVCVHVFVCHVCVCVCVCVHVFVCHVCVYVCVCGCNVHACVCIPVYVAHGPSWDACTIIALLQVVSPTKGGGAGGRTKEFVNWMKKAFNKSPSPQKRRFLSLDSINSPPSQYIPLPYLYSSIYH